MFDGPIKRRRVEKGVEEKWMTTATRTSRGGKYAPASTTQGEKFLAQSDAAFHRPDGLVVRMLLFLLLPGFYNSASGKGFYFLFASKMKRHRGETDLFFPNRATVQKEGTENGT